MTQSIKKNVPFLKEQKEQKSDLLKTGSIKVKPIDSSAMVATPGPVPPCCFVSGSVNARPQDAQQSRRRGRRAR